MSREGTPLGSFLWLCNFSLFFEDLNLIVVVVKIYNSRNYKGLLIPWVVIIHKFAFGILLNINKKYKLID